MVVAQKLTDNWSPQQISGWLKIEYLDDPPMRVSHETIYKCLFVQARGVLRRELISHLRTRRLMRRGKAPPPVDSRAAESLMRYRSESDLLR
jgi:IS30 family transposase